MSHNEVIHQRSKFSARMGRFWHRIFVQEKLNNWFGYSLLVCLAVAMGYLMTQKPVIGFGVTGMFCGIAIILTCMLNTEAGLFINMAYSFFICHFNRLVFDDNLQVGVFSDVLICATFLGLFLRKGNLKQSLNDFTRTPVVITLLLVYGYMAIELFNPNANSFYGWFPAFRKILGTLMLLFISFNVFDSLSRIKRFISFLLVICLIAAVYGCIQQWHGFFQFELDWLSSDPKRYRMTFIGGGSRKMSTMPDALSFGLLMSACSILFIAMAYGQKIMRKRLFILSVVAIMLMGMIYSLTRTANAMLVAGLVMFMLITMDMKSTRILAAISTLLFLFMMYAPVENAQTDSFRSTFQAKNDDSFKVRENNRRSVQPYIYKHPIGGGLNTTGGEGLMYNPGHELAGFPPDSGYLKKALEMGWIGFGLLCVLYFLVLKTGIHGYFVCRNKEVKLIYAGVTASCLAFYVGDFSQVAVGQITDIVVYYPFIAILLKLKQFDQPKTNYALD
jgi:putative inorganic carbon (HCO3(-)) transporter